VSAQAFKPWSLRRPLVSIVMGLDQHRGQVTGEWIDTDTGEVQRTRVVPADRAAVRKFLQRFRGRELEVALEATTGWRFVVEELRRVGAVVHLAEPAERLRGGGPRSVRRTIAPTRGICGSC
jgi:transposase